jgi:hypothetical protein
MKATAVIGIWIAIALATAHGVEAAPDLTGAFGFQFGQQFTPPAGTLGQRAAHGDIFLVTPSSPFQSFNLYSVFITPSTGLIFAIAGSREFDSEQNCQDEFDFVVKKFEEKYDAHALVQKPNAYERSITWRWFNDRENKPDRIVTLRCEFQRLNIHYYHHPLAEQGKSEIAELQKAVDDKGL